MRKVSASAACSSASAAKVWLEFVIAPASSWFRSLSALKTVPVSRMSPCSAVQERAEVAERVVQVDASPVDGDRRVLLPALERGAGPLVERIEDLVDLGRVLGLSDTERSSLRNRVRLLSV
jgi:hypothetical protein